MMSTVVTCGKDIKKKVIRSMPAIVIKFLGKIQRWKTLRTKKVIEKMLTDTSLGYATVLDEFSSVKAAKDDPATTYLEGFIVALEWVLGYRCFYPDNEIIKEGYETVLVKIQEA